VQTVARYTVELNRPSGGWTGIEAATARARRVAEEMRGEGTPVRFLRSVFVPEDESCFFLYEGPNADVVRDAAGRAELAVAHVDETIALESRDQEVRP
jgi:uncharacterized protein DUF4242